MSKNSIKQRIIADLIKQSKIIINLHINNYKHKVDANADIICIEAIDDINEIIETSLVTVFGLPEGKTLKIHFDWKEGGNELDERDFLYILETNMLFFRSANQWGAIDIENKILKRHEKAEWFPFIERKDGYILIEDDLKAEATKLNADKIHSVPIDPPTTSIEFDDRIEYTSPVFGHQVLKTK